MNNDYHYSFNNEGGEQVDLGFNSVPEAPKKESRAFAITSLVLGIAAVVLCCCCCGVFYFLTGLLGAGAIAFAIVSRVKTKKFHGLAIAGLILGIIAIILFLFMLGIELWANSLTPEEWETILRDLLGEDYEGFMDEFKGTFYDQYGAWE